MKKIKSVGLLRLNGAFTLFLLLSARGEESRFYIKGDLGGDLTSDSQWSIRGDPNFGSICGTPTIKARFEPGERAGLECGYQITDWFAAEGEIGAMVNRVEGTGFLSEGTFASMPLLFNVKFQYPNHTHWTPYIGAGVGVSTAIVDGEILLASNTLTDFERAHASGADAVFAYQAFVGLRYRLNERTGLSVEYRYLATEAPEWDLENGAGGRATLSLGRIETHAFSLVFYYRF